MVILFYRRTIADLSAQGASSMAVDILLDGPKKRTFFVSFDVDTGKVVGISHTFNPLLDDELILPMLELLNLQILLTLS